VYCESCESHVRTARYRRIARATSRCPYCGAELNLAPPPTPGEGKAEKVDPGVTSAEEREAYLATDQAQD